MTILRMITIYLRAVKSQDIYLSKRHRYKKKESYSEY